MQDRGSNLFSHVQICFSLTSVIRRITLKTSNDSIYNIGNSISWKIVISIIIFY